MQQLRNAILPVAMVLGIFFSRFFSGLGFLTPYLIFAMLLISFCTISPREIKLSARHLWLLVAQVAGSILLYLALACINPVVAQGLMICVLAPTAAAAVVIAGMLGANTAQIATFTLISNTAVAVAAPAIFSQIGIHSEMPFIESFLLIMSKVAPLLLLPCLVAFALMWLAPRIHAAIKRVQMLSFYCWAASLVIVVGQTAEFVRASPSDSYTVEIVIAVASFGICLLQFDQIQNNCTFEQKQSDYGGQSLGQKNTVLAIWMAQTYLDPISSVGPAAYILWQNLVNSWQLWRMGKKTSGHGRGNHAAA